MELINTMIDNYNIPILTAFLLGIMTSISPCPLATNITAIAYITKQLHSTRKTFLHGLIYALGRIISYVGVSLLLVYGFSSLEIANIFQGWSDKILGPILILIGLIILNIIELPSWGGSNTIDNYKEWLKKKGYLGTFLLGILFALAFCPYSAVIFFGILMPMMIKSTSAIGLAFVFGFGTSIPVIFFSLLLAISVQKISKAFNKVEQIEKRVRYFVAAAFLLIGCYYLWILIKWLIAIF